MFGVILCFLSAIACIVFSCVMFSMEAEWWVAWMFIVFAFLLLIYGLAKLDDETGCIEKFLQKKRHQRAKKISQGKHKTCPLHMVSMFDKAYKDREDINAGYIRDKAISYIVSVYKKMVKSWELVYDETDDLSKHVKREEVSDCITNAIEIMLAAFYEYGDSPSDVYSVYSRVFKKINRPIKTKQELQKIGKSCLNKDNDTRSPLLKSVQFFSGISRKCIPADYYEKIAQAFCYISLLNNSVYEDEYLLVKLYFFYESENDIFPKSWQQFKLEYK